MAGAEKSPHGHSNTLLRTNQIPASFQAEAAQTFFAQSGQPPDSHIYQRDTLPNEEGEESGFSLLYLKWALDATNAQSASCLNSIPWAALRNRDEEDRVHLLTTIDKAWTVVVFPKT